jgi:hypothetical protein
MERKTLSYRHKGFWPSLRYERSRFLVPFPTGVRVCEGFRVTFPTHSYVLAVGLWGFRAKNVTTQHRLQKNA